MISPAFASSSWNEKVTQEPNEGLDPPRKRLTLSWPGDEATIELGHEIDGSPQERYGRVPQRPTIVYRVTMERLYGAFARDAEDYLHPGVFPLEGGETGIDSIRATFRDDDPFAVEKIPNENDWTFTTSDASLQLATAVITLLAMLVVMLAMDWQLALVALLTVPILCPVVWFFRARIGQAAKNRKKWEVEVASVTQETMSSIRLVKTFGREDHQQKQFGRESANSFQAGLKLARLEAAYVRWVDMIGALGTSIVIFWGVFRVVGEKLCLRTVDLMFGQEGCTPVYRNPGGSRADLSEYIHGDAITVKMFSMVE